MIYDLESDSVESIPSLPNPIRALSFSPDDKRLFVMMDSATEVPRSIGVVERGSGKFIALPQPKRHAVPLGTVNWIKPDVVAFLAKTSVQCLNLDSLEYEEKALTEQEMDAAHKNRNAHNAKQ